MAQKAKSLPEPFVFVQSVDDVYQIGCGTCDQCGVVIITNLY